MLCGLHSLVCKQAPGRSSRHHVLNDLVARAFAAAGVPVAKEPVGLVRQDGKRPDGVTLISFEGGRSLTWNVTVVCTTADSYIDLAVQVLAVWQRWQLLAKRRNTQLCGLTMIFSRLRSRFWVLSMSRPLVFCMIWIGEFRSWAGRTESLSFVSTHFSRHPAL